MVYFTGLIDLGKVCIMSPCVTLARLSTTQYVVGLFIATGLATARLGE